VKYNGCVTFCTFPSLPFLFFLPSSTGKTTELILTHDGLYDAVSGKEVPFLGLQNLNSTFLPIFSQKI